MIDFLTLRIPFKQSFVYERLDARGNYVGSVDLRQIASITGLSLVSFETAFDIDQSASVSKLAHSYESLPSHYTGVAFKIFEGGLNFEPSVEIKASPAKILQGHNVFGPTDISLCASELFGVLASSQPVLFDMLDHQNTVVGRIDVTFSARVANEVLAQQVLIFLSNVSHGQTKKTTANHHQSTVEWNKKSKTRELIAYLKYQELISKLDSLKKKEKKSKLLDHELSSLRVMSNPDLHEFARGLVRFEARLKPRFFQQNDLPRKLFDWVRYQSTYDGGGYQFIVDLWRKAFRDVFAALEGCDMNVFDDDDVFERLRMAYAVELKPKTKKPKSLQQVVNMFDYSFGSPESSKSNFSTTHQSNFESDFTPDPDEPVRYSYAKAHRVFGFYRRLVNEGYEAVKLTMDRMTFWRAEKDLLDIGFSKAALQNLQQNRTNVIPIIKMVNVDFTKQYPDWYTEPSSRFA
ncbi:phage/plasmid replication protein, II/X family [Salmonella sp. CQ22WZ0326SAL]|uniref:phage/plasmid replication protein, II/X family n=1 Tax=Salmonella sp. CQ22WZ0326SAL TaxID=3417689 RepID=UPI003D367FBA